MTLTKLINQPSAPPGDKAPGGALKTRDMKRRFSRLHKIIALVNSYHSLECSDHTESKEVEGAMAFCEREVCRLLGVDSIFAIPTDMDRLIDYMKNKDYENT